MKTTKLFPLFALLFSVQAVGQKTETYFDYNWKASEPEKARYLSVVERADTVWKRTDYYLREGFAQMVGAYLDKDSKTAHGLFHYYHPNKRLQGKGLYQNGKREGLWLWFHENGMMSDSSVFANGRIVGTALRWYPDGTLKDSLTRRGDGKLSHVSWFNNGNPSEAGLYDAEDRPFGRWQYFHHNGQLSAEERFQNGVLVAKQYFDESGQPMADTTNRDREASPESMEKWKAYLLKVAYFPRQYKITNADEATVLVRFAVDENGQVVEPEITYSFHPDFDRIVLDALKKAPRWTPAISHNRRIKVYHTQPITFAQIE